MDCLQKLGWGGRVRKRSDGRPASLRTKLSGSCASKNRHEIGIKSAKFLILEREMKGGNESETEIRSKKGGKRNFVSKKRFGAGERDIIIGGGSYHLEKAVLENETKLIC